MNLKFIIQTLILLILLSLSVVRVSASELINGKIIKQQAQEFFNELNLGLQLVVSDKRTFFSCSSSLEFSQRNKNNWSTVMVKCPTENWSTLVRSQQSNVKIIDKNQNVGIFHIKMMLDLTKYIGFYPNISNQKAPYFDLESGCMALIKPKDNYIKDPIKTHWLKILVIEFDKILEIQITKKYKLDILNSVIRYFELHLQQFKPPKSKKVLNEIFKTI